MTLQTNIYFFRVFSRQRTVLPWGDNICQCSHSGDKTFSHIHFEKSAWVVCKGQTSHLSIAQKYAQCIIEGEHVWQWMKFGLSNFKFCYPMTWQQRWTSCWLFIYSFCPYVSFNFKLVWGCVWNFKTVQSTCIWILDMIPYYYQLSTKAAFLWSFQNNSNKAVKKIKVSVRQFADICLFSTAQYKCTVDEKVNNNHICKY